MCLCVFFGMSDGFHKRLYSITNTSTNTSNLARISMWKASKNIIMDNPVVGVGLGQYGKVYQEKYYLEKRFQKYNHPHNNILKIWIETGTVGVIGFLLMTLFIFISGYKDWLKDKSPYSLIIWSGWLSFMIFGMFYVIIDHGAITKIWWFMLAAMLVLREKEKVDKKA